MMEYRSLNPIERFLYAKRTAEHYAKQRTPEAQRLAAQWKAEAAIGPGSWRAEDIDDRGPWWFVFEEGGKTKVALRGQSDYMLIKEAIEKWRR